MQGQPSQSPSGQPVPQQVSAAAGAAKEFFACDVFEVEPEYRTFYAGLQFFDKTDKHGNVIRYARYVTPVTANGATTLKTTEMPHAQFMVSFLTNQIMLLQQKEANAKAKIKRYEDAIKPLSKFLTDKERALTQAELAQLGAEESVRILEEGHHAAVHEYRHIPEGSFKDWAMQEEIKTAKARTTRARAKAGSSGDIYSGTVNHIDDASGTAPKFYPDLRVLIDEYIGIIESITDGELKPIQERLACNASQKAKSDQEWIQTYTYLKQTGQMP